MRLRGRKGKTYLGLLLETGDDGFCDSVALLKVRCEHERSIGGVSGEASTTRTETEIWSRKTTR